LCRCPVCVLGPCFAPMAIMAVGSMNRLEGGFEIARIAVGVHGCLADDDWAGRNERSQS
jgi:hypothetical protein